MSVVRSWRTVLVDLVSLYLVGGIVGLLFGPMTVGTSAFQSQIMVVSRREGTPINTERPSPGASAG